MKRGIVEFLPFPFCNVELPNKNRVKFMLGLNSFTLDAFQVSLNNRVLTLI